jgi:hypothetical protein
MNLKDSVINPGKQWWSKRFDLAIAVSLLVCSVMVILGKLNTIYMPILLYVSLIGGVLQSFSIEFC